MQRTFLLTNSKTPDQLKFSRKKSNGKQLWVLKVTSVVSASFSSANSPSARKSVSGVKLKSSATVGHLVINSSSHLAPEGGYKVQRRGDAALTEENPVAVKDSLRNVHFFRSSSAPLNNGPDSLPGNGLSPHDLRNHTQEQVEERTTEARKSSMKSRMRRSEGMESQHRLKRRDTRSFGCFRCRSKQRQKQNRRSSSFRFGLAVHTVTRIAKRKETGNNGC